MRVPASFLNLIIYFARDKFSKIWILIFLSLLTGIIPSIDAILLKKIIDSVNLITNSDGLNIFEIMTLWVCIYSVWWQLENLLYRAYDYIYLKTIPLIKAKVMDEVYNYVQYHSHKFFEENFTGHISYRITEAARSLEMVFAIFNEKIVRKIIVVVTILFVMYTVHLLFFIIFFIWLAFFGGISIYCSSYIAGYSKCFTERKATVVGKIVDAITNIYSVRMFLSHCFERKYLYLHLNDMVGSEQSMQWFMLKLRFILGTSCSVMCFFMMYTLTYLLSNMSITIGDFVLILTLCINTMEEMWDLMQEIADLYEEVGNFSQCMSLIQPYSVQDIPNAKNLVVTKGCIEFRNVTFKYKKNNNVFNNQSIIIPGQQKVGLVGFSGSGKTTFVSLINRLYDIKSGQILIDNQNIKEVTQDSLRSSISVIPQEPLLFHRTIRENIRYGNFSCSDEEIVMAAKRANIHDFISSLSEGYNTLCGERGSNLSVGQRQRIVIARVILKNSPILILDEATSALDSVTEELIKNSLDYLMEHKTVLVIAHRLATILHMDRILVFDKGQIVEDGTHEELLEYSKVYKRLWSSQIEGFIPNQPLAIKY